MGKKTTFFTQNDENEMFLHHFFGKNIEKNQKTEYNNSA